MIFSGLFVPVRLRRIFCALFPLWRDFELIFRDFFDVVVHRAAAVAVFCCFFGGFCCFAGISGGFSGFWFLVCFWGFFRAVFCPRRPAEKPMNKGGKGQREKSEKKRREARRKAEKRRKRRLLITFFQRSEKEAAKR